MKLSYIVILLSGVAAVQAGSGNNVALNKPAQKSSTYSDHYRASADNAVDGDLAQEYIVNSDWKCFHTAGSSDNWWYVDLEDTYEIGNVVLYNLVFPNGVFDTRARQIKVLVGDSLSDMKQVAFVDSVGAIKNVTMPANTKGRFVKLSQQIQGGEYLILCEVQVFEADCSPCQNGGTSIRDESGCTCACVENADYRYEGETCEELWMKMPSNRTYTIS